MAREMERRLSARLTIQSEIREAQLEWREVRLLDLSPEGARVEHADPFPVGRLCSLELPLALGRVQLRGRVVWSEMAVHEEAAKALEWVPYQSGLRFTEIGPAQQVDLTAALGRLKVDRDK